jgi:hypothetical protein
MEEELIINALSLDALKVVIEMKILLDLEFNEKSLALKLIRIGLKSLGKIYIDFDEHNNSLMTPNPFNPRLNKIQNRRIKA